jgi:hypothetical protein
MFHLAEQPREKEDGEGDLAGVGVYFLENPVRIEAAALHKSPSRLKEIVMLLL